MEISKTSSRGGILPTEIHGFRVQSYGKQLSAGFKRGLRRLAERDFHDAACVVVKTNNGSRSGITHAGGRYVDPHSPYRIEVMRAMRDLGMEPPPPPFIVAPGEYTLYHEWGHYVDRFWSGNDQEITFSFRWLSRFYQLGIRSSGIAHVDQGLRMEHDDLQPIESWDAHAANAALLWWHASSELFANLFEDWMRGKKKVNWDQCEPGSLQSSRIHDDPLVDVALATGVNLEDIRRETYALFAKGIRSAIALPPVCCDLFGAKTDEMVDHFRGGIIAARRGDGGLVR